MEPTRTDVPAPEPTPASSSSGAPTATGEPYAPAGPATGRAAQWAPIPRRRVARIWWVTGPVLFAVLALAGVLAARPVPYIALSPGSARSVEPLITVRKAKAYPADNNILFTTVSVSSPGSTSGLVAFLGWLDPSVDVPPEKAVLGSQTPQQNERFNVQLMTSSKDKAAKVALSRLGYPVQTTNHGAVVADLDPSLPVADVLSPGDTIVGIDGAAITTRDQLIAAIGRHRPGDTVRLRVQALGSKQVRDAAARTVPNPRDKSKALLGVSIETLVTYHFPVDVSIDSGQVGGPSAGLAFTLSILDRLTPGSLTGGHRVAVTGTIEVDGSVGEVGGVRQKTEAAVRAGAELFIVPSGEYHDAVAAARGRIRIGRADTLDAALQILRGFGGDAGRVGTPGKPG
ncbi:MAG: putative secreted protein containing a domain [Acidimicrobiales bacterium]|nr:putative secreted protein containing a domain [Acidimicrobiales bacterium]